MTALQRYNLPPNAPYNPPLMARPPAVPCPSRGAELPQGEYVGRGGVFDGPAMAHGDSHCGYFSDYTGEVPLQQRAMHPAGMHPARVALRTVPGWPPETRAGFFPRSIDLGFPTWSYQTEGPTDASMAGFGNPALQKMDPMALIVNRRRRVWTGPLNEQPAWPPDMTPKGGVLDGNTLAVRGQGVRSAYYYGASPEVLQPVEMIDVMPNPLDAEPIPQVGWGVPEAASGFGRAHWGRRRYVPPSIRPSYLSPPVTPARARTHYGAQEAQLPTHIGHGGGSEVASRARAVTGRGYYGTQMASQPRAIGAVGPDGLGGFGA